MRLFIALFVCGSIWGAAGPASFSSLSLSPQKLTSRGGTVAVSVQISDPGMVQAASVQVRFPSGDVTDTALQQRSSGVWTGTLQIGPNLTRFDQYLQIYFGAQNVSNIWSRSDPVTLTLQGGGTSAPRIDFTNVPGIGNPSVVVATTANVDPASTVFVMNVFVPGLGYYTKPTCSGNTAQPVPLIGDGTVFSLYATGGADLLATDIIGYLFPRTATIPCLNAADSVPASFTSNALAMVSRKRVPPTTYSFAGNQWAVKAPGVRVGPGSNFFLSSNVFTDSQGLHLRLGPCTMGGAATWCGSEVFLPIATGYGTYSFNISGPLATLSANDVLGLYLYGENAAFGHHELDFELFRQNSDQMNGQFTVQPYTSNPPQRFTVPAGTTTATVTINWSSTQVGFSMATGMTQIAQWTYTRTTSASDVPPNGDQMVHMNLWTQNTSSTNAADSAEFIVTGFSYKPSQPSILPSGTVSAASYEGGAVAPGEIISIFGNHLGTVTFDGKAAPMIYTGDSQVTAVVPFEIAGQTSTTIQVANNGAMSDPVTLPVVPYKPALFTLDQSGTGGAATVNQDGTVNNSLNPAPRGSYISVYGTGGGVTTPATTTGQNTPAIQTTFAMPAAATVGDVPAQVVYAGGAPLEIAGLAQFNVLIPANAPTGAAIPLVLGVGPWTAQISTTIAIK